MAEVHTWLLIAVMSAVTALLRFLPFIIFRGGRKTPEYILWMGKALPYAIMGMLVVYCLKTVSLAAAPYGAPEFIACILTAALHVWKRNSLVSIGGGTLCYMLLVQLVF